MFRVLCMCGCLFVIDFLGKQLDDYVAKLPVPTYVERMGTRSGLIRARLRGRCVHVLCLTATVSDTGTEELVYVEQFPSAGSPVVAEERIRPLGDLLRLVSVLFVFFSALMLLVG